MFANGVGKDHETVRQHSRNQNSTPRLKGSKTPRNRELNLWAPWNLAGKKPLRVTRDLRVSGLGRYLHFSQLQKLPSQP